MSKHIDTWEQLQEAERQLAQAEAELSALRASQALLEAAWLDAKDLANERQLRVMDLEAAMARLDARINEVTQAWRTEQAEANDLAKEVIRLLEQIRRIEERDTNAQA